MARVVEDDDLAVEHGARGTELGGDRGRLGKVVVSSRPRRPTARTDGPLTATIARMPSYLSS